MTVAISGCNGFIGNVLVRYLLNHGFCIRGMDNFDKSGTESLLDIINHPHFEFFEGDVNNKKDCERLVKGSSGVVNLAALVGFPHCAKWPHKARLINVDGTANMIEARNNYTNFAPFILTSTGSVYGAIEDGLCTEETPCRTSTVYGLTKLEAEQLVLPHKNTIVYRYATAFGVSPNHRIRLLVNDFVYRAVIDRALTVFEADFKRTFIHVHDFARSIEFALKNYDKMNQQIYNVGDSRLNWSKRQLAEYVKEKTNCYVTYAEIGKDLDVRNYVVDYSKINKLGFYCHKTMEYGIDELIKAAPLIKSRNPDD